MWISRQKEAWSLDYAVLLLNDFNSSLLCTIDSTAYSSQAFGQFGALYMQNRDDKYPTWPGFQPVRRDVPWKIWTRSTSNWPTEAIINFNKGSNIGKTVPES